MEEDSAELKELKKQNRMVAQRAATKAAIGGFLLGIVLGLIGAAAFLSYSFPDWMVFAVFFGTPILLTFLMYRSAMRKHTS